MNIQQIAKFLELIELGHSRRGAASQMKPRATETEVMEFINNDPDLLRELELSESVALFHAEQAYLTSTPSTRNMQNDLAARSDKIWSFGKTAAPNSGKSGGGARAAEGYDIRGADSFLKELTVPDFPEGLHKYLEIPTANAEDE